MKFLITILFFLPYCLNAQTSITGAITNSFNANADGKADAGSKIFALKYEGDAIALYDAMNNFLTAKKLRALNSNVNRIITVYKDSASVVKNQRKYEEKYIGHQNMIAKIKADEAERIATLQKMGAETNPKYDLLDERSAKAISQVKLKAFDSRTVADAAGGFSLNTLPGKYLVLLISNNRTGLSSSELSGKIFVQLTEVKEGEKVNVSNKFFPD